MAIPTYDQLMLPLLRILDAQNHEITVHEAAADLAEAFKLTAEERTARLPKVKATYMAHRTGWAMFHLEKAGLIDRPRRAVMQINDAGRKLLAEKPPPLTRKFLMRYPKFAEYINSKGARPADEESTPRIAVPEELPPEESIEGAHKILVAKLKEELLQQVKRMDPFKFEEMVIELLVAMGYGGSREEAATVTQKTNDEGVDGLINEDRLGLDRIYVQAKRWQGNVGRPELQNFVGALAGKQAHKGIFITTSGFNTNAQEFVRNIPQRLILIDGQRLAELLIEHNIGVSVHYTYEIKKIDSDYFEEG